MFSMINDSRSFKEMSLGNLLPFMAGLNLYPISREPAVGKLIKVLRKIPQLILLGEGSRLSQSYCLQCYFCHVYVFFPFAGN